MQKTFCWTQLDFIGAGQYPGNLRGSKVQPFSISVIVQPEKFSRLDSKSIE